MTIDDIRRLAYNKKEELINKEENTEKIDIAIDILRDDMCFFNIDINVMVPILLYVGVEEKDVKNVYFNLISFNNFKKKNIIRNAIDLDEVKRYGSYDNRKWQSLFDLI